MSDRDNCMKIIEKNGRIILEYTSKINKKTIKRKNKAGTINIMYQGVIPQEIIDYFKVKERVLFFYKKDDKVYITSRMPTIEHQIIKIQKNNQFSIPTGFLNPSEAEQLILTLDLSRVDEYKHGLGLLQIEVK